MCVFTIYYSFTLLYHHFNTFPCFSFYSFQSPGAPDFVDWMRFSDEIESIFTTKNLEKAPLLDVEQFKPPAEWENNHLDEGMEETVKKCMERLSEKVMIDD